MKACINLSKTDLFIIDHALRSYMDREGAASEDLSKEENLLDRINDKIYGIRKREKEESKN